MNAKIERLSEILSANTPLLIAYSGGVDSAFLIAAAAEAIPGKFLAVIADSPSLPRAALADALALAEKIGVDVEVLQTQELENPEYAANPLNRCYFCKAELFQRMEQLASEQGFSALAYGENADDAFHDRPGRGAARKFHVTAPLNAAGLTKKEIREESRRLGLPTADAPAQPCLSSRIPHGTPVTPHALLLVERGEAWVRSLGFREFRVRYQSADRALVQISPDENVRLETQREQILQGLLHSGFVTAEIDPKGYRSPVAIT